MKFQWNKKHIRLIAILLFIIFVLFLPLDSFFKTLNIETHFLYEDYKGLQIDNRNFSSKVSSQIRLDDIFFSIKTSGHTEQRMDFLILTWLQRTIKTTTIVSDHSSLALKLRTNYRVKDTDCKSDHSPDGLVCKMAAEFETYLNKASAWWCHFDDDMYVNTNVLLNVLRKFDSDNEDIYIGRTSLKKPLVVVYKGKSSTFWFAHGGCGFCVSRKLAMKMKPFIVNSSFETLNNQIKINDDCLIGFVINYILKVDLIQSNLFNSHYKTELKRFSLENLRKQVTLSYNKNNRVEINDNINTTYFNVKDDPSRFYTIHCMLYPTTNYCQRMLH